MSGDRLGPAAVDEAATALLGAYETREPIAPLIDTYDAVTLADAYRIQQTQVRAWTMAGDPIRGHKIGLVSRAIQEQMGVDEPDYGHLTASMFRPEGEPLSASAFFQPRIEAEIAFVLGAPLQGPGLSVADAIRAVDYALPALEIVDSRIRDWEISIFDTVADNASSGAVILGTAPARLTDLNLACAGCLLTHNGAIAETGAAGAVMGSPLHALVWLANAIGEMDVALEPGHVVLSGSMTRAVAVAAGDVVTGTIEGLGAVTVAFHD